MTPPEAEGTIEETRALLAEWLNEAVLLADKRVNGAARAANYQIRRVMTPDDVLVNPAPTRPPTLAEIERALAEVLFRRERFVLETEDGPLLRGRRVLIWEMKRGATLADLAKERLLVDWVVDDKVIAAALPHELGMTLWTSLTPAFHAARVQQTTRSVDPVRGP